MTATELKIGDLVYFQDNSNPCRIDEINSQFVDSYHSGRCYICDLKPVFLTDEILEKNGWRYSKDISSWLSNSTGVKYGIYSNDEGYKFTFGLGEYDKCIVCITYVHELQHILWVLGFDDNLKV